MRRVLLLLSTEDVLRLSRVPFLLVSSGDILREKFSPACQSFASAVESSRFSLLCSSNITIVSCEASFHILAILRVVLLFSTRGAFMRRPGLRSPNIFKASLRFLIPMLFLEKKINVVGARRFARPVFCHHLPTFSDDTCM